MFEKAVTDARILIVDDSPTNILLAESVLRNAGYADIVGLTDPQDAVARFEELRPDLVLLDWVMPGLSGLDVLEKLGPIFTYEGYLPVLVLTASLDDDVRHSALASGARDFLTKPFDRTEVELRVRNLLEARVRHVALRDYNEVLEQRVRERTQALADSQVELVERLARALEYRDDTTGHHVARVGENSARLARVLGATEDEIDLIRLAAPLHDVGKIAIPDRVLMNTDDLTAEEFEIIKTHPDAGAAMLGHGTSAVLQLAERIAATHHERWNGSGYPRGLAGEEIPFPSRVVAVADSYDALVSDRPYKSAWAPDAAVAELARKAGTDFDPQVIDAMLLLHQRGELLGPT